MIVDIEACVGDEFLERYELSKGHSLVISDEKAEALYQELKEKDKDRRPKLRLQYTQVVMMDFFRPREDGHPDRARWPHISINTLDKVYGSSKYDD